MSYRLLSLLAASAMLVACADDRYAVLSGGPGTQTAMAVDLHACKMEAVHTFYRNGGGQGAAIGGVLGGAAGALIGIGLTQASGAPVPSDMNRMTEACMRAKGYEGSSN